MSRHASIIPLIGGETLGCMGAFGEPPEWIATYSPFKANEKHLVHYLRYLGHDVEYRTIDEEPTWRPTVGIDSVSSVCPCAGLSFLSTAYGADNPANEWMYRAATWVLEVAKPRVYWGENAPHLAGKVGRPVVEKLLRVAKKNGYSMSLYKTKSLLHGVPQVRERAFYFFWKGDKVPILDWYDRPYERIESVIAGAGKRNFQMEPISGKTPSRDDPYYRYLLEVVHGGITHREHFDVFDHSKISTGYLDVMSLIEKNGHDYLQVAEWMGTNGYDREVVKCRRKDEKLRAGGNIMRRGTMIPKNYIGAFVSHYPTMTTHPYDDRYITYREAMTIMGLPDDFELLDPRKSVNHICQNVPVQTARDMAVEVREWLDGNRKAGVKTDLLTQCNHTQTVHWEEHMPATLETLI